MDVTALLELYKVDQRHARHVADLALALFDAVAGRYKLPVAQRHLVELGALLHNVGLTTDPPAHHLVGRDIVLRHTLHAVNHREQALVACMVAFHRKKVRPQLEPAYLALGKKGQREALRLAAIVRVADGLDEAHTQTTSLVAVEPVAGALLLHLAGPHAVSDGTRAVAKADLWAKVFAEPLHAAPALLESAALGESDTPTVLGEPDGAATLGEPGEAEAPSLAPWYAAPEVALAELGRVLLRRHLRRLLAAEREVCADQASEPIHALRIATRRLRATLRLLAPVCRDDAVRVYTKAIRRIAQAAGAVRDRDVLLADLQARAASLGEPLAPALEALVAALREERRTAHAALVAVCASADHAAFLHAFAVTISATACWDNAPRVRDLGGSTLWRHYEALRAHDRDGLPTDDAALHAMRIDGKRLRYVLELFADTLGASAEEAVKPLVAFQDHLGTLNDGTVAQHLLAPHADAATTAPAVGAYLALREEASVPLIAALPARWQKLNSGSYRRKLLGLIVRL